MCACMWEVYLPLRTVCPATLLNGPKIKTKAQLQKRCVALTK